MKKQIAPIMKYITIGLLLLSVTSCNQRNKKLTGADCARFHKGVFINKGTEGDTRITRSNEIQIEEHYPSNSKAKLKIEWMDSCTYKLKFITSTRKDFTEKNYPDVIVHILETTEDYYVAEAEIVGRPSFTQKSKVYRERR